MDFLIQFIMPFFAVLTAILIATTVIQMKSVHKHENKEESRHNTISTSQKQLMKEVQSVHKKIDSEVIPSISAAFTKKSSNQFETNQEGIISALNSIGFENHFASEDGEFCLVGIEDSAKAEYLADYFKTYNFLHANQESKDLMIETHSYEFNKFNEEIAMAIFFINNKFKISGFSVENFNGRYVLKSQHLIDTPDSTFNAKTIEFILESMFRAHSELVHILTKKGVVVSYIEPHDLTALQNNEDIPNKAIKSDA